VNGASIQRYETFIVFSGSAAVYILRQLHEPIYTSCPLRPI
jgi:hypothetical protein